MSTKNSESVGMGMKNEENKGMGMENNSTLLPEQEKEPELSEEQADKVMNKLREELKDIEIPESMEPENMMNVLENRLVLEKKKTGRRMIKRAFCGMAACFVLGIGLYSYGQSYQKGAYQTINQESKGEQDTSTQKNTVESTKKETEKESTTASQQSTTAAQATTKSTETKKIQETTVNNNKKTQETETQKRKDALSGQKDVRIASDYNEIYDILTEANHNQNYYNGYEENFTETIGYDTEAQKDIAYEAPNGNSSVTEGVADTANNNVADNDMDSGYVVKDNASAAPASASTSSTQGVDSGKNEENSDYSKTNTVEENVDEADIVKTDGKYIYTLCTGKNQLEITKVGKKKLSYVYQTTIQSEKKKWDLEAREMYLQNDKLIIISNMYGYSKYTISSEDKESTGDIWSPRTDRVRIDVYDISNKNKIKRISSKMQDGTYYSSRISDGILYVFTDFLSEINCDYSANIKEEDIKADENCLPKVAGKSITPKNTYILTDKDANNDFFVISAWNVNKPKKCLAKKTILGEVNQIYVSQNSIYLMKDDWKAKKANRTKLLKFSYKDGSMEFVSSATVKGIVNNSFAANESNGYLRVVAHVTEYGEDYNTYTNLYILDSNMKVTGSVKKLAEGEELYAVRYMNDIAYFVTYEQVDPLFSVDVSDPANPKVIGKLKIPGFSEYLHLWSDNLLLGIGTEDDYVKLSMFDISDPSNVKEVAKKIIEKGDFTSTAATSYYKSVCIVPEKNIIGFNVFTDDYDKETEQEQYLVFSYSEKKGFQKKLTYTNYKKNYWDDFEDEEEELLYEYDMRGIYIGNQFFVVVPGKEIVRYNMKDYSQLEKYSLQKSK